MVMVNLPAARRHHRSRVGYAFGLFLFLGLATVLALAVRHPAFSATQQLAEPVPAPEITVAGEGARSVGEPVEAEPYGDEPDEDERDGAGSATADDTDDDQAGSGAGEGALADRPTDSTDLSRSLFYSGLLGLAISLAGLGLVGTRRRQW
ncbi:hypothetical protein O7600_18890 [Micromonospora sp. WMMA1998]|uniref:hypothetical protein n=1 Tax=Micromonospora sp. WMMA1998 TaxID=3015167 RepID=UPI00248CBE03|nr:hypothetical protein [Micromonospora sp. WMMA1998]WBC13216.1 hypothetical protein O7600_18890 [Micromonospora sp. WMMA1998]